MSETFALQIEKYLDHAVNTVCKVHDEEWDLMFGPDRFREAVGTPLVLSHHRLSTRKKEFRRNYFTLDSRDFLEYATSELPGEFSIGQVPPNHCCYYQGFPQSVDEPHFENRYGKFTILGACLSRMECHLFINVHFRSQLEGGAIRHEGIEDLVDGLPFFNEFVSLHSLHVSKDALESQLQEHLGDQEFSGLCHINTNWSDCGLELTRARITPPFRSDYHSDIHKAALGKDGYSIMYSGAAREEVAENLEHVIANPKIPADLKKLDAFGLLSSEKQRVGESQHFFEHEMADQFEITRLMRFLPSYFAFMYDLVIDEKKQVGAKTFIKNLRKKDKRKAVRKPVFKIIKSLRISNVAENKSRFQLEVAPRRWTAPSHLFVVKGHWRNFRNLAWRGQDQDGKEVLGRTWVKDYMKGHEKESLVVDISDPGVVIQLKQPLSYARDLIRARQADQNLIGVVPEPLEKEQEKPSQEWMYEERIKLTAGLRYMILKRDGFKCNKCGQGIEDGIKLEVDHIRPVSKWGRTELQNLRTLCNRCNRGKGTST